MNLPAPTDDGLLRDFARNGSQAAFRQVVERYAGLVFSAALRRTGHRALAEEVAQNVFAVLARKAAALAGPEVKLSAWLHRATVLEAARASRRESNRQRLMHDYFQHAGILSAEDAGTWQALLPELDAALDTLPSRDRELLLARFYEDRSYRELAETTGRSEAALMQHQHRALEKLGTCLRRRGIVLPAAGLGSGLGPTLAQAAPAGLAASWAASAPPAAAALGHGMLFLHSINTIMQIKTHLTLAAAFAAVCLLGGTGAFLTAKSQAESKGTALLAAARHATRPGSVLTPEPPAPSAIPNTAPAPTSLTGKLDQAVAGWRTGSDHRQRLRALEVLDRLTPEEVPAAQAYLAALSAEPGLQLELTKRIAVLWGRSEPDAALSWTTSGLPREHRGDPMQAILTDWSRRAPQAALTWWQGTVDSLDFPIPEHAFERFETLIYSGWAEHDPVSLAASLPESLSLEEIGNLSDSGTASKLMGLATAATLPANRQAVLEAIAGIPSESARAAAAGMTATMMNATDPEAGRGLVLSLKFSDPQIRGDLLGRTAMMNVMMAQQEPAEAVAWLRQHSDEATTRRTVETFIEEQGAEGEEEILSGLRLALDPR